MSKFYVGQRVRCIHSVKSQYLIGECGTITDLISATRVTVDFDRFPVEPPITGYDGPVAHLEPLDDSRELTTWAQCEWKPKELTRA